MCRYIEEITSESIMDIFEGAFHNPRTSFNGHCLNDTHKRALEAICSNSEETIRVLQQELTVMPTDQQQQLLRDLEEMFEPHFAKHLMLNLSNDWIIKYYAMLWSFIELYTFQWTKLIKQLR